VLLEEGSPLLREAVELPGVALPALVVVERDFLVEQGLLVGTTEYFSKSHVLKREYEDEEHPFGWMQDGVFELFDREGRLYRWQTEENLVDVTAKLP